MVATGWARGGRANPPIVARFRGDGKGFWLSAARLAGYSGLAPLTAYQVRAAKNSVSRTGIPRFAGTMISSSLYGLWALSDRGVGNFSLACDNVWQ